MRVRERPSAIPGPSDPGVLDAVPAWVHAVLSAIGAAFVSSVIVVTPVFVVWLAGVSSTVPASQAVQIGLDVWLLVHGAPLHVGAGVFSLVPWLLTLLPLTTCWWAAHRLVARLGAPGRRRRVLGGLPREVLTTGAAFAGGYAVVALLISRYARLETVQPSTPHAVVGPFLIALLAYAWALRRPFAADPAAPAAPAPRFAWGVGEYVPLWLRRAVRPALLAVGLLLLAGVVGVLVVVAVNSGRVLGLYGDVGAGWFGNLVLTLGQLAYLPTAAVWALAFAAGPGFGIGTGSSLSWGASDPGFLPLVPALGALPDPGPLPAWTPALVTVPILVGVVLGHRCLAAAREAGRGTRAAERVRSVLAGVVLTGLIMTLLVALTSGSLGAARLAVIGASPWPVGAALTGELLVGAVIPLLLSGLRLRRPVHRSD